MFTAKSKGFSLSLLLYTTLALVSITGSDAKSYAPAPAHIHRREHFNLNRLIRKRASSKDIFGSPVIGAGNDPPKDNQASGTAASTQSVSASAATNTPTDSSKTTPSNTASSTPSSSVNDPLQLSSIVNSLTNTATATSTSAAATTPLVSSPSPSSSSSSSAPSSSPPASISSIAASQTPAVIATSSPATTPSSIAKVTITTHASEASATASSAPTSSSARITRTTLTVLIIIVACVGGTAILWTIIRKWKFRASSQFEDRMRPIDWQPTTDDDSGLPVHRRAGSSTSSFHSGSGHDGLGGGYGSTSDHGRSASPLPPIPDHDFTPGPASLAPVGGYADLARGPSPQPQMQEALTRGPSMVRPQYDQYGVPLHHQGGYGAQDAYDYNGSARY